ncbi:MAG: hypothetical protein WD898_01560 [Candidatus Paceibacterota bacterium]
MNKKNQQGVAILFAILLVSVLISMVLVFSSIFIPKIRSASDVRKTTAAAYAAESAIEWCIYINEQGSTSLPVMNNGATFVNAATGILPTEAECATFPVTIIGTFGGVSRAFEISL